MGRNGQNGVCTVPHQIWTTQVQKGKKVQKRPENPKIPPNPSLSLPVPPTSPPKILSDTLMIYLIDNFIPKRDQSCCIKFKGRYEVTGGRGIKHMQSPSRLYQKGKKKAAYWRMLYTSFFPAPRYSRFYYNDGLKLYSSVRGKGFDVVMDPIGRNITPRDCGAGSPSYKYVLTTCTPSTSTVRVLCFANLVLRAFSKKGKDAANLRQCAKEIRLVRCSGHASSPLVHDDSGKKYRCGKMWHPTLWKALEILPGK